MILSSSISRWWLFPLLLAAKTPALLAAPATNCPAATRAYSIDTPLMDLMINPATKQVLEQDAPKFIPSLPPILSGSQPPSLSAVLTIRIMSSEFVAMPPAMLDKLNHDLAAVPVTHEASVARCARYDQTPPRLPDNLPHPAILVFSKSTGFRDNPSVDAGITALKATGEKNHWGLAFTENAAAFNTKDLKRFDAVVWNNVSGDVLTMDQRRDFKNYIEQGGGFAGFHGSGGDPYVDWDWYADTLIGAHFLSHPMDPQFQSATLKVDDSASPIVAGLSSQWTMADEWYSFKQNPRKKGADILVTLDESTYKPMRGKQDLRMGDHPIAWTQHIGKGRSFYSAIGHRPEGYSEPNTRKLIEQGVAWAAQKQ